MTETGLAFSGGGIRSAAFSSGVLRRLLQRNTKIDYLSCVSGGGYTGSAYVDWKYRNGNNDDPEWHQRFFEHMRERSGLMCNWQIPLHGVVNTLIILFLILFVCILMPLILWSPYVFPVAYAIDLLFGNLLRAEFHCPDASTTSPPLNNTADNATLHVSQGTQRSLCQVKTGTEVYYRVVLFSFLASMFVLFFILSIAKKFSKYQYGLFLVSSIFGLLFSFTFLPFCIQYLSKDTPVWVQLLVLVFSLAVWIFFPVLRSRSSFVVVVYLYSYFVYWRVFKDSIFGLKYSDYLFFRLMFAFGFVLWIAPALGAFQQRLVYLFNRWRLQSAFYTRESVGKWGCQGIGCEDIFLTKCKGASHTQHEKLGHDESGPLTLGDLGPDMKPQYMSNMVVNEWSLDEDEKQTYELLVMSPTVIERLDRREGQVQFEGKLEPNDVKLSAAMATSAAAVARNMGAYENSTEGLKQLQVVLGLGMDSSWVSDTQTLHKRKWYWEIPPYIVEVVRVLPLVTFPLVYFMKGEKADDEMWVAIGVLLVFIMLGILTIFSVLRTGRENPGTLERLTRWFVVYVPIVRYMRQLLSVSNRGPSPPPILLLSDGGHIENLGILPLLKKRLTKIVVADGGLKTDDSEWGKALLHAFSLAREKLHCSFIGLDGRDVIEDIKEKFVNTADGFKPRSYRCKVHYYEKNDILEKGRKVGEGEILLLTPRHPNKGIIKKECVTWKEALRDINVDLEAGKWGTNPQQNADEVDSLTCCCCDCCHRSWLQSLSPDCLCGVFPRHSTANQFFTPRMFTAYHCEGYNACLEAEAAEFLGARQDVGMASPTDDTNGAQWQA
ncbi:uncharacterized protein LOC114955692 [Acropora millepora]|uniref:uncharacterized protein LOC114955692 n=1 Tax=Acropora millepora TaxID=45264 RepID=UPI001CF243AC|nr:uncharacterized protein LOC114955692 [Acropora millepora]